MYVTCCSSLATLETSAIASLTAAEGRPGPLFVRIGGAV